VLTETLDLLRCPYCGGRLELVTSLFFQRDGDEIIDGILGCHCCIFPVVSGIPVLHLQPQATTARDQIQAAQPELARRTMFGLDDEAQALTFERAVESNTATYRELVEALGPQFEGGYFLYRFSDPTYLVANAVVGAVAGTVLRSGGRAVDICGGSGHLTRSLLALSSTPPVLADLYFAKVWLARRFTAPGCEGVCCDGNAPLPFARGTFRFAMCSDAFQYIWTKRQFIGEMARLIDHGGEPGAVLISHTHNERQWSPSHGQPLAPEGYRDLFETLTPRILGETALLADVVKGGPLDLSRNEPAETLDREPALTIVATSRADVLTPHPLTTSQASIGELRLNPVYAVTEDGDRLQLRLRFPSQDYEDEYSACRQYLSETATVERRTIDAMNQAQQPADLADLVRRRIVLDLPKRYY
jgi:uncharacterized protein YbaR (Trm112 family)/SAM-dependent methyltransferase